MRSANKATLSHQAHKDTPTRADTPLRVYVDRVYKSICVYACECVRARLRVRVCVAQLKTVERYDPVKNEWELVANMGNVSVTVPAPVPVVFSDCAFVL